MSKTANTECEDIDLAAYNKEMDKAVTERAKAKSYCRVMMRALDESEKVMDDQDKKIKSLQKNRDPRVIKESLDLMAKARAGHGMDDISKYASRFKDV